MPKFSIHLLCLTACLALGTSGAWAGGDLGMPDDHHENEGPPFFGFVKDAGGRPVADAKVTATVKNGLAVITRTTAVGMYKFGGFDKQINPNDITISCAKDGYRQTRILRRTPPGADSSKPIEIECRLERG